MSQKGVPPMTTSTTNPITAASQFDARQFYRSPLFRTMAGYKLLSGTFLMCGVIAVPALLYTGTQEGIGGAAAVGVASLLPISLQTLMVPRYIARMRLEETADEADEELPSGRTSKRKKRNASTAPIDMLDMLVPQSKIRIDYFTLLGPLRSRVEKIGDLRPHVGFQWKNWCNSKGMGFYVEKEGAGPILKKIVRMIDNPDKPESWRTY